MSKPVLPWSLKGVSPEAREIAKKAAAQQGMTIGEWVSRAIRDVGPDEAPAAATGNVPVQGEALLSGGAGTDAETVREAVRTRIYESEERVAHMVGPLQEIIERLSRRMTRIEEMDQRVEEWPEQRVDDDADPRRLDGW
ncbi:hypothetical protein [Nisaea sp.]|uniref:hypothetical protein n=1 Tax=Nisaea sp. TaxID=2024842 RepID=UPI003266752A